MLVITRAVAAVHCAFPEIALSCDCEARKQTLRLFFPTLWTRGGLRITLRDDVFEHVLTFFAFEFAERHLA
jgi:hypothetical protein